jgi:hypothetical protein
METPPIANIQNQIIIPNRKCKKCDKAFKIADKVAIEDFTEDRYHFACMGSRKPVFIGVHREKDDEISSVDRARLASRLKKIRRQAKKAGFKLKTAKSNPVK